LSASCVILGRMHLMDDARRVLDADYACQNDGGHLALALASAGGASSSHPARNPDYVPALGVLLGRLRDRGAVIVSAVVESAETRRRNIPESDRRLLDAPVRLAALASTDDLLRQLTIRQAAIGQSPGARGGNSRRRIKLALDVPGFGPHEAGRLAAALARPPGWPAQAFLFTWNPDNWDWPAEQFARAVQVTSSGGTWPEPHLRELSQVEPGYRVDPVNDLRPVCPNCHAMLHRRQPALTIDELRQLIRRPKPG